MDKCTKKRGCKNCMNIRGSRADVIIADDIEEQHADHVLATQVRNGVTTVSPIPYELHADAELSMGRKK